MHVDALALRRIDLIRYVRDRGHHVHVELAEEAFLHDLHVEQAEEAAAEAEAQCQRTFRLEYQRGVVELELLERCAQVLVLVGRHGEHARVEHGLDVFETGDGRLARARDMGNGIAHLHLNGGLDARDDVAHRAAGDLARRAELHLQYTHLVGSVLLTRVDELHTIACADGAVLHLEVGNDAAERVEHRVEDQGLQRGLRVALGRRDAVNDGIEDCFDALSGAGRGQ